MERGRSDPRKKRARASRRPPGAHREGCPKLVSLNRDPAGVPYLAAGSPHAYGPERLWLYEALRPDLGPLRIEKAQRQFRRIPESEPYPHPETCVPYREANGLGFMLQARLPLFFVKTRGGDLLPDARTALAYARENESDFSEALAAIAACAQEVLRPDVVSRYEPRSPLLFRDLVQPYATFAQGFLSIPAGLYVVTSPGIGTMISPPSNRPCCLSILSGLIETDWHHHALFLVSRIPSFDERSLLIPPGRDLAQVYFVAYRETADASLEHSTLEAGGQAEYEARWTSLSAQLIADGKGVTATRGGVASVTLECLHCRASVTRAAEGHVPDGHQVSKVFVHPYKVMKVQNRKRRNRS